jgi:type VI secretion system protein
MSLILQIVNASPSLPEAAKRKVFENTNGSIGRLAGNDWVLPDPNCYVSGRHARIHFDDGQYLLEDISSNGVFINARDSLLGRGQLHRLKTGDRIYIDSYEISVSIAPSAVQASSSVPASDSNAADRLRDPFEPAADPWRADPLVQFARKGASAETPGAPQRSLQSHPLPVAAPAHGGERDPLMLLGLQPVNAAKPSSIPSAAQLAQQPVISDFLAPAAIAAAGGTAQEHRNASRTDVLADYDPLADDSRFKHPKGHRQDKPVKLAAASRDLSQCAVIKEPAAGNDSGENALGDPVPTQPRSGPAVQDTSAGAIQGSEALSAFLQGAGLADMHVTRELTQTCGRLLRAMLGGAMQVLRAREKFKDAFRILATRLESKDNNPIKFAGSVEDAMRALLVSRRGGSYKAPEAAVQEVFQDLCNHQIAILTGMQRAFDSMLDELDPKKIEAAFERQPMKSSLVPMLAKSQYWERFCEQHAQWTLDRKDCFQRLFANEFMKSYEQQLKLLKQAQKQDTGNQDAGKHDEASTAPPRSG